MEPMHTAPVTPSQHESLVDLLCELNAYYRRPGDLQPAVSRDSVRAHLQDNLLSAGSALRLVVASRPDGTVVGLAAVMLLYSLVEPSPARRGQCMVKELFVRESARSEGAGRALMAWVARFAVDQGCGRIDWNVMASNGRGIAFYEGLGARKVADRLSYRLERSAIEKLAAGYALQPGSENA